MSHLMHFSVSPHLPRNYMLSYNETHAELWVLRFRDITLLDISKLHFHFCNPLNFLPVTNQTPMNRLGIFFIFISIFASATTALSNNVRIQQKSGSTTTSTAKQWIPTKAISEKAGKADTVPTATEKGQCFLSSCCYHVFTPFS